MTQEASKIIYLLTQKADHYGQLFELKEN